MFSSRPFPSHAWASSSITNVGSATLRFLWLLSEPTTNSPPTLTALRRSSIRQKPGDVETQENAHRESR